MEFLENFFTNNNRETFFNFWDIKTHESQRFLVKCVTVLSESITIIWCSITVISETFTNISDLSLFWVMYGNAYIDFGINMFFLVGGGTPLGT